MNNSKKHFYNYLQFLPSIAVAVLLFFYITGGKVLDVNFYEWLSFGDPSQHYLGWLFFKDSAVFQKIAGANPNFGYETAGSIVYTDSIPIVAIFFKTFFKNFLSPNFQYFGLWLLFCFVMQAICAMILLKKFTDNFAWQFLGSLFFIFSSALIFRIFFCEHYALAAHFLVLISFILYFSKDFSLWRWVPLFIASLGVHFYIFLMIFTIFFADLMQRILIQKISIAEKVNFILEKSVFAFLTVCLAMWQYGYFIIGVENSSSAFNGYANFNLASFIDSGGWSKILPDIKEPWPCGYEGFCYLGLSILLMLVLILFVKLFAKAKHHAHLKNKLNYKNLLPIGIAIFILTIIALSNHIFFGDKELLVIPISKTADVLAKIIRASGRMIWPLYYAILLFAIIAIIRLCQKHNFSKNKITFILAFLAVLQIADLSLGIEKSKERLELLYQSKALDANLKDKFWQSAKEKYKKIVFLPVVNYPKDYGAIAYYGAVNHIRVNTGYFARMDQSSAILASKAHEYNVRQGIFEKDAIYVVNDEKLFKAAKSNASENDLVQEIDGYKIIAPDFNM